MKCDDCGKFSNDLYEFIPDLPAKFSISDIAYPLVMKLCACCIFLRKNGLNCKNKEG